MSPWKCQVSYVTIGGEKREVSKPKHSREGKGNPEISLSISINAGEKWLTFFYGVPHQYSELFFHSSARIWLPAPQMPPVLGRHKVLSLAVVLNLGCKLESPGGAVPHPDVPSASQKNWVRISRLGRGELGGGHWHLTAPRWCQGADKAETQYQIRELPSDRCVTSFNMDCSNVRKYSIF